LYESFRCGETDAAVPARNQRNLSLEFSHELLRAADAGLEQSGANLWRRASETLEQGFAEES
jgi:hypothetical protein